MAQMEGPVAGLTGTMSTVLPRAVLAPLAPTVRVALMRTVVGGAQNRIPACLVTSLDRRLAIVAGLIGIFSIVSGSGRTLVKDATDTNG